MVVNGPFALYSWMIARVAAGAVAALIAPITNAIVKKGSGLRLTLTNAILL